MRMLLLAAPQFVSRMPAFAPLGLFAHLFALLAPHREGQSAQPRWRNWVAALAAVSVGPFVELAHGLVDSVQDLPSELKQRKRQFVLRMHFGGFAGFDPIPILSRRFGASLAKIALDLVQQFVAPGGEDAPNLVVVNGVGHGVNSSFLRESQSQAP